MAGFEPVGGLIRQLKFNSAEKRALGALQIVSLGQTVVDKWAKRKFGEKVKISVVAYQTGALKLETRSGLEVIEVRKNSKGLILVLNRSLGRGLIKQLKIKPSNY